MSFLKPEIYIGSKVEHASERAVLVRLLNILAGINQKAIVMANINVNGHQIDAVLALDHLTLVIEAKGFNRPIRGGENGDWQILLATGEWRNFPNPYLQVLTAKLALRDAMRTFIGYEVPYPSAAVVFVPHVPVNSSICFGDFKVTITQLDGLEFELQKTQDDCLKTAQWQEFARHHRLTLVQNLDYAFNTEISNAETLLTTYTTAFMQMYGYYSEKLVDFKCTVAGKEIASEEVAQQVSEKEVDLLLRGPSGCGKTLLAARIGIHWIKRGGMPLTIPAKDYRGNLKDVLEREVGLLSAPAAAKLFRAAKQLSWPILFILDGYNECQESERTNLTRSLSALLRRYEANFLVTSQISIMRPDLLAFLEIEVQIPSREVKLAIAQNAAGGTITHEAEALLDSVGNGLEADLVGIVGKELSKSSSRYALFDAFARKRLDNLASDGIRALSRVAGWLSERVAFSLSIRDVDRLLDAEHLPTSLLAQLSNANLLIQRGDRLSFSHELFYDAFAAEAVIRRALGHADPILSALNNPRHAERQELIIGAIDDDVLLQQILESITDARIVASCLSGTCGRYAREWAEARFPKLIHRISEEVKRVRFILDNKDGMNVLASIDTLETWSDLDRAFIYCLPELLAQGIYLHEILYIIAAMDQRSEEESTRLREQAREKKIPLRNSLFANIYVFQHHVSMGLTYVCSSIQAQLFHRIGGEYFAVIVREKLVEPALSAGQLYLILALCRQTTDSDILTAPLIRQIIERYWSKAPYHLKLELMQAAGSCWGADDAERNALIATIEGLPKTENIFLSTEVLETLQQLGALEDSAEEHQSGVRRQVKKFLSEPENEESCSVAHHVYYCQFDHPFSNAYWQVVSELTEDERKRFLAMAAKGVSDTHLFLSSLLLELVSFNDPKMGEIISRWTEVPPQDSFMSQDAIQIFVIAHISLGRLGCPLPIRISSGNFSAAALTACGNILYWLNRINISEDERHSNCIASLDLLQRNAGVALDAIRQCAHVRFDGTNRFPGAESVQLSMIDCFPAQFTEICRHALHSPAIQSGYFRHFSERDRVQVLKFALDILGMQGNEADLYLLRQFGDDLNLGQRAIKAIKNLERRVKGAI